MAGTSTDLTRVKSRHWGTRDRSRRRYNCPDGPSVDRGGNVDRSSRRRPDPTSIVGRKKTRCRRSRARSTVAAASHSNLSNGSDQLAGSTEQIVLIVYDI